VPLLTRRRLLAACGLAGLAAGAARFVLPRWWRVGPPRPLDDGTAAWVDARLARLDRARIVDAHVHAVGLGPESGCWVNPEWNDHGHPIKRFQFEIYLAACGIEPGPGADAAYVERLVELHRLGNPAGRLLLLPFDWYHAPDGARVEELSAFHVPNEYVLSLAEAHPETFVAAASVHPYRVDAVDRLEAALARGARAVKWLPAAQGIDPAAEQCDPFYERLAESGRPLIVHCGEERSMAVGDREELGNPLRLRRALDHGVTVIVAHCAGRGEALDLDEPEGARTSRPAYRLFRRMLEEERYASTLFGDVSAMPFVHRANDSLAELLADPALAARLVYGSDYPLPGVDVLTMPWVLERRGFLAEDDVDPLERVWDANPLLFALVLTACLHAPDPSGGEHVLPPSVFHTDRLFA
jgi:mannonate dehydratase